MSIYLVAYNQGCFAYICQNLISIESVRQSLDTTSTQLKTGLKVNHMI